MISQEHRRKYQIIRPAAYAGIIAPCSRCGSLPQLFVIDPVGTWLRYVMPDETFFAVRCGCGETGKLNSTGRTAIGTYIDEQRAAALAVRSWNAEQESPTSRKAPQATPPYGRSLEREAL